MTAGLAAECGSEPATRPDSARVRKTREGTKQVQSVAMLRRPEGVTIAEVVEATSWQPHTVRGVLVGELRAAIKAPLD